MSEVVVINHLSLDGVMQAPGRPDEDTRNGFTYGGWGAAGMDDVVIRTQGEQMATGWRLLLGRRTYEDFYAVWPKQTDSPFSKALDDAQKYVASTTLSEPLPWVNSTLLAADATEAVARLREEPGENIVVMGSGELVRSLMAARVIDRYMLMIHPLLLGAGRRLFGDGAPPTTLRLVESVTTTKGVVIGTYEPAEPVKTRAR